MDESGPPPANNPNNAPQIRSRVTVVCAECKRLKLRCDRRNPCGSCLKRDTVSRCIYSPAAAEKVDLHSLNNRLIQVESMLAQLTSGQFTPSYPFSLPPPLPPATTMSTTTTSTAMTITATGMSTSTQTSGSAANSGPSNHTANSGAPSSTSSSCPTLMMTTTPGTHASLAIPIEQLAGTWLNDLGVDATDIESETKKMLVKMEPDVDVPQSPMSPTTTAPTYTLPAHTLLPPTTIYFPASLPPYAKDFPLHVPLITSTLVGYLPPLAQKPRRGSSLSTSSLNTHTLQSLLSLASHVLFHSYPGIVNWCNFFERAVELGTLGAFSSSYHKSTISSSGSASNPNKPQTLLPPSAMVAKELMKDAQREKKEKEKQRAYEILYGSTSTSTSSSPLSSAMGGRTSVPPTPTTPSSAIPIAPAPPELRANAGSVPSLPFFAAVCGAVAVGVASLSPPSPSSGSVQERESIRKEKGIYLDPTYWFALSQQALGVWEAGAGIGRRAGLDLNLSEVEMETEREREGNPYPISGSSKEQKKDDVKDKNLKQKQSQREKEKEKEKEIRQADLDHITALQFQAVFLARFGAGELSSSRSDSMEGEVETDGEAKGKELFLLVGKMTNLARDMGLDRDPDEGVFVRRGRGEVVHWAGVGSTTSLGSKEKEDEQGSSGGSKKSKRNSGSKFSETGFAGAGAGILKGGVEVSLWEAEMRRKAWWGVVWWDLYISDLHSCSPLIPVSPSSLLSSSSTSCSSTQSPTFTNATTTASHQDLSSKDHSFTTKLPVPDIDEQVFSPYSKRIPFAHGCGAEEGSGLDWDREGLRWFEWRARLSQLVRSIKRRMNAPVTMSMGYGGQTNGMQGMPYTIDQAASMEAEVKAFLDALPSYYKLDFMASSDSSSDSSLFSQQTKEQDPYLLMQRYEIALIAYRLILRVYLPFMRKHASGVPHQASLGTVNAAHGIVKVSEMIWTVWKGVSTDVSMMASSSGLAFGGTGTGGLGGAFGSLDHVTSLSSLTGASFDLYPFSRSLFDALVVCVHAVCKQPTTVWAPLALEDVDRGLAVLKETRVGGSGTGRGVGKALGYDVSLDKAVKIVDGLRKKVGKVSLPSSSASPSTSIATAAVAGTKRKHDEIEGSGSGSKDNKDKDKDSSSSSSSKDHEHKGREKFVKTSQSGSAPSSSTNGYVYPTIPTLEERQEALAHTSTQHHLHQHHHASSQSQFPPPPRQTTPFAALVNGGKQGQSQSQSPAQPRGETSAPTDSNPLTTTNPLVTSRSSSVHPTPTPTNAKDKDRKSKKPHPSVGIRIRTTSGSGSSSAAPGKKGLERAGSVVNNTNGYKPTSTTTSSSSIEGAIGPFPPSQPQTQTQQHQTRSRSGSVVQQQQAHMQQVQQMPISGGYIDVEMEYNTYTGSTEVQYDPQAQTQQVYTSSPVGYDQTQAQVAYEQQQAAQAQREGYVSYDPEVYASTASSGASQGQGQVSSPYGTNSSTASSPLSFGATSTTGTPTYSNSAPAATTTNGGVGPGSSPDSAYAAAAQEGYYTYQQHQQQQQQYAPHPPQDIDYGPVPELEMATANFDYDVKPSVEALNQQQRHLVQQQHQQHQRQHQQAQAQAQRQYAAAAAAAYGHPPHGHAPHNHVSHHAHGHGMVMDNQTSAVWTTQTMGPGPSGQAQQLAGVSHEMPTQFWEAQEVGDYKAYY